MTQSVVDSNVILAARQRIDKSVSAVLAHKRFEAILGSAFISIVVFLALHFSFLSTFVNLLICGLSGASYFIYKIKRPSYRLVNVKAMAEHFNRRFPELEESLALVLKKDLTSLAKLQRNSVAKKFLSIEDARLESQLKLSFQIKDALLVNVLVITIASSLFLLNSSHKLEVSQSDDANLITSQENESPSVQLDSILVQPPKYTGRSSFETKDLNLKVLQGSTINWKFRVSEAEPDYYWIDSDDNALAMDASKPLERNFSKKFYQTGFYKIGYKKNNTVVAFSEVYTIEVTPDRAPKVKVLSPIKTLVEFAKTEVTHFTLSALVIDDYGIEQVDILASVAKGSGEAVKFRDKTFQFTQTETAKNGKIYSRDWTLPELDMEPGDEVYFHIKVKDNKKPQGQWTKSTSIIVRWLDDEIIETAAQGIQIRFIPEYFRSQRQIIIETEQLIADRRDLTIESFEEKSRDLGHSQSDLKEKYGQYLGDEFGEGEGAMHGLADGYHGGEDVAQGEASAGMQEDQDKEHSHEHGRADHSSNDHGHDDHAEDTQSNTSDLSGASELIAEFAHNHGQTEVGPLSKRDPKSWMKQAVHEMWQAELHLMLGEPEKALPFEYKAYDYLKLARQAERIYVKRLGFEPPPVKEDRRLSGELDDILSYSLELEKNHNPQAQNKVIEQAYLLLNQQGRNQSFGETEIVKLKALGDMLLKLSEERPALIQYAAMVEKMMVVKSATLADCDDCLIRLKQKLWQLASPPNSVPVKLTVGNNFLLNGAELGKKENSQ